VVWLQRQSCLPLRTVPSPGTLGKQTTVPDRALTQRQPPLKGDALRLFRSLQRLVNAIAVAETERDIAEGDAACNAATRLINRLKSRLPTAKPR
jgi:hypothetical protein